MSYRHKRGFRCVLASAVLFAACPAPALAADCDVTAAAGGPDAYLGQLLALREFKGCMGGKGDTTPLSVAVQEQLPEVWLTIPPTDTNTASNRVRQALRLIEVDAADAVAKSTADWQPAYLFIRGKVLEDIANLERFELSSGKVSWEWNNGHQAYQLDDGAFAIDYAPIIRRACSAAGDDITPECAGAMNEAMRLIREVNLIHRSAAVAGEPRIASARSTMKGLVKEWDYYFNEARSQYLWELWLNSELYDAPDDRFIEPPSDQWILLHPSPAFEYVGGGPHNEQAYSAIVMLEVAGYNRFKWSPRSDGRPSRIPPLGASVVATYTPDNTGERSGYGLIVHLYNNLSIGITRRNTGAGSENTYLVTGDLMKVLLKPDQGEALEHFVESK